ncbi:MAG: hypothetical protein K8I03_07920 [Ignavibacteria bacterium]|nr:hypothetical protein [Ignavibacteria bacterium]
MKRIFFYSSLVPLFASIIMLLSCKKVKQDENQTLYNNKRLRDVIVSYMSEPQFRNPGFVQEITGTGADLKLFDMDEMMLYFSISKNDYDSTSTLLKLTIDVSNVEFGFVNNGDTYLGAYTLKGTDRLLFRFPKNDFKPDSSKSIRINFNQIEYSLTANELADFAEDKSVYGGNKDIETLDNKYLADHGSFVSKPKEPSLLRLVSQLAKEEKDKNRIAQILLDFVTTNIKYNRDEGAGNYEVMKRASEVLMTGNADCSGLTILYASLLEQAEINYLLVYFQGHIAVGVEGKFPSDNNLNFDFEGTNYTLAETTAKGFVIGLTRLQKDVITNDITFVQRPGKNSQLVKFR